MECKKRRIRENETDEGNRVRKEEGENGGKHIDLVKITRPMTK